MNHLPYRRKSDYLLKDYSGIDFNATRDARKASLIRWQWSWVPIVFLMGVSALAWAIVCSCQPLPKTTHVISNVR